ncbi:hypothetical protein SAMN05421811_10157 [Nonomuraea wenchangensis]|uniref:Uncharacterized protein n=1 Tax=Nonomuraea wenchangensis TaxID=568860 RepID=A0A1H9YIL9_9ACTN|nr:hypothetical protein SAMN05421811_10157 [Nonomuraea wenchangensis]
MTVPGGCCHGPGRVATLDRPDAGTARVEAT